MNVLLTGPYGRVGTAIIDHLADRPEYDFTYLNRSDRPDDHPYGGLDTIVADISEYDDIRPAFDDHDAVIHLAAIGYPDTPWPDLLSANIDGMYNVIEAARDAGVPKFVYSSSNHVVGMYEVENVPEIYDPEFDLTIDHAVPARPKSVYGVTNLFGEGLGRYYVEAEGTPEQFYALRICGVRYREDDPPWSDAERGVRDGKWERGSEEYMLQLAKRMAMGTTRRDFAHMVDCCLQDESVSYDVFNVVSDNDASWFDISHAREVLGYDPRDNMTELMPDDWDPRSGDAPPELEL